MIAKAKSLQRIVIVLFLLLLVNKTLKNEQLQIACENYFSKRLFVFFNFSVIVLDNVTECTNVTAFEDYFSEICLIILFVLFSY